MVAVNGTNHNGYMNGINGNSRMLHCESDYEERPVIDITPSKPAPGWRSQWPEYTHNVTWLDSDSKQHSLTIRTDDLDELLATLTTIKNVIRASKAAADGQQPAAASQPQASTPAPAEDTQRCEIHGVDMPRRWSKRTQGHYFGHQCADGSFCYGRAKS